MEIAFSGLANTTQTQLFVADLGRVTQAHLSAIAIRREQSGVRLPALRHALGRCPTSQTEPGLRSQ
jgi:hypothetical protein